jgi:protein SCO1/2
MSSGFSFSPLSTSGADPQLPRRIPRLGWAIAFLVATTLIAWSYLQFQSALRARGPISPRLERFAEAPNFQFTAQDGSTVTKDDLKGRVWVANFIFTRCLGPCPIMTSRMAELNQRLGTKAGDVNLVSFSVDPEYDSPEVLKAYGEKVGARAERWKFLTGPKAQMDETIVKGFLQPLAKDQEGMPVHSTRFVLVDKDGWIRGFQDGNDPEVVQKLLMDIGDVLREPAGAAR